MTLLHIHQSTEEIYINLDNVIAFSVESYYDEDEKVFGIFSDKHNSGELKSSGEFGQFVLTKEHTKDFLPISNGTGVIYVKTDKIHSITQDTMYVYVSFGGTHLKTGYDNTFDMKQAFEHTYTETTDEIR